MKKFLDLLKNVEKFNTELVNKETGNAKHFASKMAMSKSKFFEFKKDYILFLEENAPGIYLVYDNAKKTYCYSRKGSLKIEISFEQETI